MYILLSVIRILRGSKLSPLFCYYDVANILHPQSLSWEAPLASVVVIKAWGSFYGNRNQSLL